MAFKHIEVAEIVRRTADRIAQVAQQVNTVVQPHGVQVIDEIPCIDDLAQFARAIRKTNRHVKFGITRRSKFAWASEKHMELCVYMEGDMYAMATIGYSNYSVGKDTTASNKFMVASRTIKNEKYKDNRDEYHMTMTDTLDRAVKNAAKYIRRYTTLEVAAISHERIRHKLRAPAGKANSNLYDAKRHVRDHMNLETELLVLLESGYSFISHELRDAITELRDAQKANTEAKNMSKACYFVTVRLQNDDMMCDVVRLHSYEDIKNGTDPTVVYKMEELPEELAGRIAVLSMVEDDQYVDNVGIRVNSSTFWVHA
jgi:hypothetical protein